MLMEEFQHMNAIMTSQIGMNPGTSRTGRTGDHLPPCQPSASETRQGEYFAIIVSVCPSSDRKLSWIPRSTPDVTSKWPYSYSVQTYSRILRFRFSGKIFTLKTRETEWGRGGASAPTACSRWLQSSSFMAEQTSKPKGLTPSRKTRSEVREHGVSGPSPWPGPSLSPRASPQPPISIWRNEMPPRTQRCTDFQQSFTFQTSNQG